MFGNNTVFGLGLFLRSASISLFGKIGSLVVNNYSVILLFVLTSVLVVVQRRRIQSIFTPVVVAANIATGWPPLVYGYSLTMYLSVFVVLALWNDDETYTAELVCIGLLFVSKGVAVNIAVVPPTLQTFVNPVLQIVLLIFAIRRWLNGGDDKIESIRDTSKEVPQN